MASRVPSPDSEDRNTRRTRGTRDSKDTPIGTASTWYNTMPSTKAIVGTVVGAAAAATLAYNYWENPASLLTDSGTVLQWGASKGNDILSKVGSVISTCLPTAREALYLENGYLAGVTTGVAATMGVGGLVTVAACGGFDNGFDMHNMPWKSGNAGGDRD